jgi:hypothetical protein
MSSIRNKTGGNNANISVNSRYPFIRTRLQQLAGNQFLNSKDNTIFASYTNRSTSILNGLDGVFDLFESKPKHVSKL